MKDYSFSLFRLEISTDFTCGSELLKNSHRVNGMLQKIPPAAPSATNVTNEVTLLFGNPNVAPNKGMIVVRNPTGMSILKGTSIRPIFFDILLTITADIVANAKKLPQTPAKDPGLISARTNTMMMNIAANTPVQALENRTFFQFIFNTNA